MSNHIPVISKSVILVSNVKWFFGDFKIELVNIFWEDQSVHMCLHWQCVRIYLFLAWLETRRIAFDSFILTQTLLLNQQIR